MRIKHTGKVGFICLDLLGGWECAGLFQHQVLEVFAGVCMAKSILMAGRTPDYR